MRIVEGLDNRLNAVGWLMLNVFLLWDVRYGIRLRKWKEENKKVLSQWFEVIAEFELINSMATMTYNRPKLNFPKANDDNTGVKARTMGHLLLNPKERVDNDFIVDGERFFILTGANMAGKSTFLRALGTNWVLASMGSPVCAESFDWTPSPLFSSMRTSDSLADHESYFFAELKRLKFLIDETEKGNLFIILDEILKGTNSEDKARGSKLFVEKLLERDVKGIIATHDLSLCTLSEEYPKAVRNLSFEVEFTEDDLSFDYKLREGVCKNMNASFLLEKMGLINKSS
jgi:DNA mismatch repair ATPase MutS